MAIPAKKEELVVAIQTHFNRLLPELDALAEPEALVRSMEGHAKDTRMSPADLVAYLLGWHELVLKWLAQTKAGQPPDLPETGYQWNELGRLAQKFYRDYASVPYGQRIERLRTTQRQILDEVNQLSNQELYGEAWYRQWTLGRMIQLNTSSPYQNARARLRKWKKRPTPDYERSISACLLPRQVP
ncbi:MAG: ClbS/DfsB family four-helix bundle protein [Verrucomicrobiota bacterium JB022]|nr:ClbS/DfsB family four-helix bundle protein [Verrucomicrobiota bacterium JB022]